MQNSEAVEAWIQGKMATFRILVLVSKTEIASREFSFSSRSLRMKIINLNLVSMPEIGGDFFSVSSRSLRTIVRYSRSRLDVRDWIGEILILVSRLKKWLSLTSACDSRSKCRKDQLNIDSRVGMSESAAACDVREWVVEMFWEKIVWPRDILFQTINWSKNNGFNRNCELS